MGEKKTASEKIGRLFQREINRIQPSAHSVRDTVLWEGRKDGLDREDAVLNRKFSRLLIKHNGLG